MRRTLASDVSTGCSPRDSAGRFFGERGGPSSAVCARLRDESVDHLFWLFATAQVAFGKGAEKTGGDVEAVSLPCTLDGCASAL